MSILKYNTNMETSLTKNALAIVYMLSVMCRVGAVLRSAYHCVALSNIIFLVMDNTGGDGMNEYVIEYTRLLKVEFNV